MRPGTLGPRSVMVTITDLLFARSITRTLVPNGKLRWAAVGKFRSNKEPLAVFLFRYDRTTPCRGAALPGLRTPARQTPQVSQGRALSCKVSDEFTVPLCRAH